MKNITVSLEEDLYRKSRVAAAEADTSVTALVREFLTEFTGSEAENRSKSSEKVLAVVEKLRKRHPNFRPEKRLAREEVHTR